MIDPCMWCDGNGEVECEDCGGTGDGVEVDTTCDVCDGTGTVECDGCEGSGES